MKIVIAPDSFKGTFCAAEVCETVSSAFAGVFPDADIISVPLSDGGEGTCAVLGAKIVPCAVTGPDGANIDSFYGIIDRNAGGIANSAIIECAACAGLGLTKLRDPSRTTTYGMGELILAAARAGIKNIVLSLGGSATNDCGCGLAAALGVRFYGESKQMFVPTGATLANITRIDMSGLEPALDGCVFTAICDVTNPLYGERGAAHVFAPQKGADAACVEMLDRGAKHFAEIASRDVAGAEDIASLEGGGAAGGLGAAARIFLEAELKSGIAAVSEAVGLREKLAGADICVTGEGRYDSQSLSGKVISGVSAICGELGVPVIALCGAVRDDGLPEDNKPGCVAAALSVQREAIDFSRVAERGTRDLYYSALNVARIISLSMKL
ncbi:MAG: glycerate kinase [Eubacteriales bacterium]